MVSHNIHRRSGGLIGNPCHAVSVLLIKTLQLGLESIISCCVREVWRETYCLRAWLPA